MQLARADESSKNLLEANNILAKIEKHKKKYLTSLQKNNDRDAGIEATLQKINQVKAFLEEDLKESEKNLERNGSQGLKSKVQACEFQLQEMERMLDRNEERLTQLSKAQFTVPELTTEAEPLLMIEYQEPESDVVKQIQEDFRKFTDFQREVDTSKLEDRERMLQNMELRKGTGMEAEL